MSSAKMNSSVKAFKSFMAKQKKVNDHMKIEYEIAFQTSNDRGHVYGQKELKELYSRNSYEGECGATKVTHKKCHDGEPFKYIVVKRFRKGGYLFASESGNQLIAEIDFWEKYAKEDDADFLCPMLKWFKSKSDKVDKDSPKMQDNVIIISQRALYVDDCKTCCDIAERLNDQEGYTGEPSRYRYSRLREFSSRNGWRDCLRNPGNSGVIFDYEKQCYKAVFIDYAL